MGSFANLTKLRALSARERRILLGSVWRIARARLETRFVPFRRIAGALEMPPDSERGDSPADSIGHAAAVKWSTQILSSKLPWCGNCLAQAVAAKRYLNRRGIPSTLYLGVTTEPGSRELAAHAWLESGGQILTGESTMDYKVIYSQS